MQVHLKQNGFTLVEVMIAVVVLCIAFFAVASMQISAVNTNSSAIRISEGISFAQAKLEELMALEYTTFFTDPHLIDDASLPDTAEPFTDLNGNGLWDTKEPYVDKNHNGIWDPAHPDMNPPAGYVIGWSVFNGTAGSEEKHIRVYVTPAGSRKTIMLTCIKSRG